MRMTLRMFYCVLPVVCLTLSSPVMAAQSLKLLRADRQQIPAQAYLPDAACKGVAVISHGAGGSEKGYAYLAEALAARGWLAVVPAHQESGTRVLGRSLLRHKPNEALTQMVTDSAAYRSRLEEIGLAKDWARQRCAQGEAVLLGHSMGAATTMIEAGAENLVGVRGERRFDRYVAMSPQGSGLIFPVHAWSAIRQPVLMLTGTRDAELGGQSWQSRTEAFTEMPPGCKWLGVIDEATHSHFGGRGLNAAMENLITSTVFAFLDGGQRCVLPAPQAGLQLQQR